MKLVAFFISLMLICALCFSAVAQTSPTESKIESDKFQRNDARTMFRLLSAQGFLKEEKKNENGEDIITEPFYIEY